MRIFKSLFLSLIAIALLNSCAQDNDDKLASDLTIKNFIYRGMNAFYLYKPDVPVLADDRFSTVKELEDFHAQFDTPEDFFESLIFDPNRVDRFSVIFSDYIALEQALSGNSLNNGMEFGLVGYANDVNNIFGYVRYVLPNTSAAAQGVVRGQIFTEIDGIQLTRTNFRTLIAQNSYTITLADYNNGDPIANGNTINLTKAQVQEDPILVSKVIDQGNAKVGYLVYNSFLRQFDDQLNSVFANFKSQGITHLVIDLRYNSGGSVNSAITLGSLVTNNPTTDVFSTEQWNPDIQEFLQENNPDQLVNFFKNNTTGGAALNRLSLSKVHIITTGNSASASELLINSLDPYVNVVQVGDDTAGKFQASITLYDSEDFTRQGANPAHRYAMQPLVLKSLNSVGRTDYFDGLQPDIRQNENFGNLGVLGDPSEPLLNLCLNDIAVNGRFNNPFIESRPSREFSGSNKLRPLGDEMWKEEIVLPQQ
ncbi:S41 family peptidase [Nonlabens marinus]|uniref:Carboxyl-terminal protease n=1 Tax=Nonlabens marinus S1-08 TaxID=1454201 RepID=W8VXK4_9FLAO|nr:S41 family peptidase [Nonlabens marinus]BAO56082.1 carboxyl-terminal protease [Nonlabens marinus S1-08]